MKEQIFVEVGFKPDKGIERLLMELGINRVIYNRDVILEQLNGAKLTERQKIVLIEYYGINGKKNKSDEEIAKELGISKSTVYLDIIKGLERLRGYKNSFNITNIPNFHKIKNEEDRKTIEKTLSYYTKKVFNGELRNNNTQIQEFKDMCEVIEKFGTTKISEEQKKEFLKSKIKDIQYALEVCNTPIEKLGLTNRAYNCLKRTKINTIQDIKNYNQKFGLDCIVNLGKNGINEIMEKVEKHVEIHNKTLQQTDNNLQEIPPDVKERLSKGIIIRTSKEEKLNLITGSLEYETKNVIYKLKDLKYIGKEYMHEIEALGEKAGKAVIQTLEEYGITFEGKEELEFQDVGRDQIPEFKKGEDTVTIEVEEAKTVPELLDKIKSKSKSEIEKLKDKKNELAKIERELQNKIAERNSSYKYKEDKSHNLGNK